MYDNHDKYLKAKGNRDAQERWARQLTWEIARHAAAEEIVFYPLLEEKLGQQGLKLAERDRAEHQVRPSLFSQIFPSSTSLGTAESERDALSPGSKSQARYR
jgi:hypothetical protein